MSNVLIGIFLLICACWFGAFLYIFLNDKYDKSLGFYVDIVAISFMCVICLLMGISVLTGWF